MVKLGQYFSLSEDHPNKSALGELVVRHSRLSVKIQRDATVRMMWKLLYHHRNSQTFLSCDPPVSGYRADDSCASSILLILFADYPKAAPMTVVVAEPRSGLAVARLIRARRNDLG